MKKTGLLMIILLCGMMLQQALATEYYFFVQFTDKHNSPFSTGHPETYLSARALERRSRFNIAVDSTDLPVNPTYIQQLIDNGARIHSRSKWLNGATVITSDSSIAGTISKLDCIKSIHYTGTKSIVAATPSKGKQEFIYTDYGSALEQLQQVKGTTLHEQGYKGKGILIAVLDAGFKNANIISAFDSLRNNNNIQGTVNITDPATDVYDEDQHGTNVLSIMAANKPGTYIGTAPEASFWLIKTEYVPTETLMETDFWVRGLEFADSVGADIINSSLGYSVFDDPRMNYSYADMDGRTVRSSIAAEIAAEKGIIVCNSAGNSGSETWRYITSPADAHNILAVGAVDRTGNAAGFSSYGPTSDGRTKPDVVATGYGTRLFASDGTMYSGNGTSFSAPIITGLTACYLQFLRDNNRIKPVSGIIQSIIETGQLATNPHPQLGYGIPDFSKLPELTTALAGSLSTNGNLRISFHSHSRTLLIERAEIRKDTHAELFDISGRVVETFEISGLRHVVHLPAISDGIYILKVREATNSITTKITVH